MTDHKHDADWPTILLLTLTRDQIESALQQPPLISALQSFENSLLLLAHRRYPQAVVALFSATESAYKAHFKLGQRENIEINPMIEYIRDRGIVTFNFDNIRKGFQKVRNQIIHYGYSTKDDEIAADSYFRIGLPFFDAWIMATAGFSPIKKLVHRLPDLLVQACQFASEQSFDATAIEKSSLFVHAIGHHIREALLTPIELSVLNRDAERGILGFESRCEIIKQQFGHDPAIHALCPCCGRDDELLVQLDESLLDQKIFVPIFAECLSCGFYLPDSSDAWKRRVAELSISALARERTLRDCGLA